GRGPRVPARPRPLSGIDRRRRARTRRDLPTRRSGTSPAARSGGGVQFRATPRDRHARERPARAGLDLPVSRATESGGPHPGRGLAAGSPRWTWQGAHTDWRTPRAMTAAELVKADQEHLIHPLHHPIDNAEPLIYVRGRGATIQEIGGHEYIDG